MQLKGRRTSPALAIKRLSSSSRPPIASEAVVECLLALDDRRDISLLQLQKQHILT